MSFRSLDPYIYQDTCLHKINTKVKLICLFVFLFLSSITIDILSSTSLLIISIFSLYLSKISISKLINKIKYPIFILCLMVISIILFSSGLVIYNIQSIKEILCNSYILLIRSVSSLLFIICFFGTTKLEFVIKTLIDIHVPNIIIQIFMFSYRFVFVLIDELTELLQIVTIKGFKFRLKITNLIIISNLIGVLFIKSFEKSDLVYYSMISKGYSGIVSIKYQEQICINDYIIIFSILFYLVIYIMYLYF